MSQQALDLIKENIRTKNPVLDLGNCGLTELYPELLDELAKTEEWLEELILSNGWRDIETGIWKFTQNNGKPNYLPRLPSSLPSFTQLQILVAADLGFTDCSTLAGLTTLKKLFISDNQITDSSALAGLTTLSTLDVSRNQISDCYSLFNLTSLRILGIAYNHIADCSPLGNLLALHTLYLYRNQISDYSPLLPLIKKGIPIRLEWDTVEGLYLYENPATNPPLEILELNSEAVIRYFESGRLSPLNECKIIFVGDAGAGKTSLIRQLVDKTFNPQEQITHGINKQVWHDLKDKNGNLIRVNLWDFGGQQIQHSLHQFFYSERIIYILVLNPRKQENAWYWLEQINALGKGSEVLVVYNWRDEKDKESMYQIAFYELAKRYIQLKTTPFILSCKTGEGIETLKNAISKVLLNQEDLKSQYPVTWFNIKNQLEKAIHKGISYISYETYQQWCSDAGYTNPEAQKGLLKILDSIGSIVFFDKPLLNEYLVLNPEWITTGVYYILVAPQTQNKRGHLDWNDLKDIFKENKNIFSNKEIQFTEKQICFILELMLSYNLCQKNPFAANEYLIPAAFGEQPGKDYEQGKAGARHYRIKFQSPFEMLIIHRFIAKNLQKITEKDYWQSGIYIKHPGSQTFALVETNQYSQEINCWIKGDNVRGFWEVIRNDFHEILSLYHNLPYEEEVLYEKDGNSTFLSYQEMRTAFQKGKLLIGYHPSYGLTNISVPKVLELFEPIDNINTQLNIITEEKLIEEKTKSDEGKENSIYEEIKQQKTQIYFSYAWADYENSENENLVDILYKSLIEDGFSVIRDEIVIKQNGLISSFIDRVASGQNIIIFLSERYIRSSYCMYELYQIFLHCEFKVDKLMNRIYPIWLEKVGYMNNYEFIRYWQEKKDAWHELISKKSGRITAGMKREFDITHIILDNVATLLSILANINTGTPDLLSQNNFAVIKRKIKEKISWSRQSNEQTQYSISLTKKSSSVSSIDDTNASEMKRIFISYSKDDLVMVNHFLKHLAPLQRSGLIENWYCTELMAGSDWNGTIQAHFDASDIICFMVSPNFNATNYIYDYELKKAFDRKEQPGTKPLKIVPVIMKYCIWIIPGNYNLGKYTALPYTTKPIADFKDQDMAWLIVAECIRILCSQYDSMDPTGDECYKTFAFTNKDKLGKQLLRLFERIVEGKVDNNS